MIVLLSQEYFEPSTDDVIDWIRELGGKWKRINGTQCLKALSISNSNEMTFDIDGVKLSDVGTIWFRRWISARGLSSVTKINPTNEEDRNFAIQMMSFQKSELNMLFDHFFSDLPEELKFNRMEYREINKLMVLKKANLLGLDIPNTLITTSKQKFDKFKSQHKSLITKAISNGGGIKVDDEYYRGYTNVINEIPKGIPYDFFPSLFQSNIQKKFEIRSFYIENKIYSMAIFSQNDKGTVQDFRQYNHANPNRMVPYKLPKEIEEKLIVLAKDLNLNCASFDLIKSTDNKFIFLEVNPGGQFGMVSFPCNYNLEKIIASELIKKDNGR